MEVDVITSPRMSGGRHLPPGHASLAFGVPASAPGTIHALGLTGGVTFAPKDGRTILFGRHELDVHVCLGRNDRAISRKHGLLDHHDDHWWLSNTGLLPLLLPNSRLLFAQDEPVPLGPGYTPMFVRGSSGRQYMLELYVSGRDGDRPADCPEEATLPPKTWRLKPAERLALTVLSQRYLMHETHQHPLTWKDAADQLRELQPVADWTGKRVERMVGRIRAELSREGVSGLTREEIGEPVGNQLNHNLIRELMESTTLTPADLRLLEDPPAGSVEHDD
jgi:hypothetical protein